MRQLGIFWEKVSSVLEPKYSAAFLTQVGSQFLTNLFHFTLSWAPSSQDFQPQVVFHQFFSPGH